jgi:LPXTG-motif cell wall-anchored protein
MKKFAFLVAAFAMLPALVGSTSAFADSPGQLSNGATNYKVRNVTQNGAYAQTATAVCNDVVKYSVILSNSDFGLLKDVTVKANLASGAINASAKNAADATTSVSGSAKVTTDGTLKYVPGSTVRIKSDGVTRTALSDGVTANGVNAGDLNGSTQIFVQYEAKVNCDKPPVVKNIEVCELDTKNVITIREDQFDSSKHSKNLADCVETPEVGEITVCEVETGKIVNIKEDAFDSNVHSKDLTDCASTPVVPTELPQTGASASLLTLAGLVALTAGTAYFVQNRRNTLG